MPTGPLWVGLTVTLVSALVGWRMVNGVTRASLGEGFPEGGVETVRRRVQRDLDAVQVAASVIAFFVAAVTDRYAGTNASLSFTLGAGLTLVSTLVIQSIDPNRYDRWCKGPLTPFSVLVALAYLVALAVA